MCATVAIDFGASRTAFSVFGEDGTPISPMRVTASGRGSDNILGKVVDGLVGDHGLFGAAGNSSLSRSSVVSVWSSYLGIEGSVSGILGAGAPLGVGSDELPPGVKLHPSPGSALKGNMSAAPFGALIEALIRACYPGKLDGANWVVGRSEGVTPPRQVLGWAGRDAWSDYAESMAVAWEVAPDAGKPVLVADWGAGYLDVALMRELKRGDKSRVVTCNPVSRGSYPIGVQHFSNPFSTDNIATQSGGLELPAVQKIVASAIVFHLEHAGLSQSDEVVVVYTGGAFRRTGDRDGSQIHEHVQSVFGKASSQAPDKDTKEITVNGLKNLAGAGIDNPKNGSDLTGVTPNKLTTQARALIEKTNPRTALSQPTMGKFFGQLLQELKRE